jgi:hypothetical protein
VHKDESSVTIHTLGRAKVMVNDTTEKPIPPESHPEEETVKLSMDDSKCPMMKKEAYDKEGQLIQKDEYPSCGSNLIVVETEGFTGWSMVDAVLTLLILQWPF